MHALARCSSFAAAAVLLSLTLAPSPARAQSPGAVSGMGPVGDQEKAIWDALQADKFDVVSPYLASNFVYVGEQIEDRAHSMEDMKSCKLNSYSLRDAQTRTLSKDMVLVTYVAAIDQVCGQHPYKGDLNCSSLWQRQNGKWVGIAHTETMAAKP